MSKKLSIATLIAFVGGIVAGGIFPSAMSSISFLGTIYINLLKILIVPVLFFSITSALSTAPSYLMSKITVKTILLFMAMFIVSFLITSGLVAICQPGIGFTFIPTEWNGELASMSFADFMLTLFPSNIIAAASNNTILPVIIFAFAVGIAAHRVNTRIGEYNGTLLSYWSGKQYNFFNEGNKIFNKILSWVMYLTPIGVFALMANTVANYGIVILGTALKYIGMAWLGCFIICILVMILPAWIWGKVNPIDYIKKVSKVWIIALSTCSSAATLPTTIKTCNEDFGVPEVVTNIVVPLGCTIHMCGGAVSFALLGLFNCQMFGIVPSFGMFCLMLLAALLINMGAPGIPGGGIVIGATYLSIFGIPLNFIGFYAGIYRLLDMPYTTMNVTGDITANILINKMLFDKK